MELLEGRIYGESHPKGFCARGGGSSSFLVSKMKGIFKGFKFISQIFVFKEPEMVIGYPTDVKHLAHIGYSSSSSIPSWMAEFNTASDFSSGVLGESRGLSWASHVFVYQPDQDSVLQVDMIAYKHCNTSSYIAKFDDGNTVFTLNTSGPFYFISGDEKRCIRNESLIVVVMADRSVPSASTPPPPSPESLSPPSPMEGTPSPAPEVAVSTPPPSPPPSAASMKLVSYFGLVGGGVGLLLLVL